MDQIREHYKKNVLGELCMLIKRDKKRKVCKDCGQLGHSNKIQLVCPIKINEDKRKREHIKKCIMNIDSLGDYNIEEVFEKIAKTLEISLNSCKSLYSEIPAEELLDRNMDIKEYIRNIHKCCCFDCGNVIMEFSKNRIWRDNIVCDYCWDSHRGERELMWNDISEYKKQECYICRKIKRCHSDRFNYDHLNMFDKSESICCMVDRGDNMKDIFSEIDKCQILCVPCHHIVTSIEQKTGFTRIKSNLTKKYNNKELTDDEYIIQKVKYQEIYEKKMKSIYEEIKKVYQ